MATKKGYILVPFDDVDWIISEPTSVNNAQFYDDFNALTDNLGYDDEEVEKGLKKIIKKYPFHIDSYVHLHIVFLNQRKDFEAALVAEKAFRIAQDCIPATFDVDKHRIQWSFTDNRPFLRAYHNYGLECTKAKDYELAVDIFKQMLSFNPNDNTGVRYLLLEIYFAKKRYAEIQQLFDLYPEEFSIEFCFGKVALAVLNDDLTLADTLLQEAIETNKHFINELKKDKHRVVKNEAVWGIALGSEAQAYEYWKRNKALYRNKKVLNYFQSK